MFTNARSVVVSGGQFTSIVDNTKKKGMRTVPGIGVQTVFLT